MYTIIFQVPTDASSEILFGCGSTTRMKARDLGEVFRTKTRYVKCQKMQQIQRAKLLQDLRHMYHRI